MDIDDELLVRALASSASSGTGVAGRPGQLRERLEAELGPADAARLRPAVHQLTVAAEEHVPGKLAALAPLSIAAGERVAADLAVARGWALPTAQRVTALWAAALGLADAGPRPASGTDPGQPVSDPGPAGVKVPQAAILDRDSLPGAPWAEAAPARPAAAADVALLGSAIPLASQSRQAQPPAEPQPSAGEPVALPAWPPSKPSARVLARAAGLPDGPAAAQVYGGWPMVAYLAVLALVLVISLTVLVVMQGRVGGTGLVLLSWLAAGAVSTRLRLAVLVADETGVATVELKRRRTPVPGTLQSAPWSEVTVRPGLFPRVDIGNHRVELGMNAKDLGRAMAARAAASRESSASGGGGP